MRFKLRLTLIALRLVVRLVLDSNTALSALIWQGVPGQLIKAARHGEIELFSSTPLLAELYGVITRDKFTKNLELRGLNAQVLFAGYASLVHTVEPAHISPTITRDPSDDAVLACALAARADFIISGDAHLLDLKQFQSIPTLTATQALSTLGITNS
jgi:uncharacterized protein